MDLIPISDLNNLSEEKLRNSEFYKFLKDAFEDGAVPETKEEFINCFDNLTTNGGPCFANKYGEFKDIDAMMFFFPDRIMIPLPAQYHQCLRDKSQHAEYFVDLKWKSMVVDHVTDINFLKRLLEAVELRRFMKVNYINSQIDGLLEDSYKVLWGEISNEEYNAQKHNLEADRDKVESLTLDLRNKIIEKINELKGKKDSTNSNNSELI